MFKESCEKAIFNYVIAQTPGTVFALSDFIEFGTYDAIRQALSRLAKRDYFMRLVPGIYYFIPDSHDGEIIYPTIETVAEALARNYKWTILPGPELARFLLGLNEEKPSVSVFLSSGNPSSYSYDNFKLSFVHCSSKFISSMPYDDALVISALSDLDNHKITASEVYFLSQSLPLETKKSLISNLSFIPARLRPVIEIICDQYGRAGR